MGKGKWVKEKTKKLYCFFLCPLPFALSPLPLLPLPFPLWFLNIWSALAGTVA
jgi:hypothetical protein